MDGLEMLDAAKRLAHELVDQTEALNYHEHARLSELPDASAVATLASEILSDASFDTLEDEESGQEGEPDVPAKKGACDG